MHIKASAGAVQKKQEKTNLKGAGKTRARKKEIRAHEPTRVSQKMYENKTLLEKGKAETPTTT